MDRLAHGGIIFAPIKKSLRNGKKTFTCLKKVLRNFVLIWDLRFRKTKYFEIQFPSRNRWQRHYITLKMKVGCEKWQILLVWRNQQFRKLSGMFYFYFRKCFPSIYLTKWYNYFATRKSYRPSLYIENYPI